MQTNTNHSGDGRNDGTRSIASAYNAGDIGPSMLCQWARNAHERMTRAFLTPDGGQDVLDNMYGDALEHRQRFAGGYRA